MTWVGKNIALKKKKTKHRIKYKKHKATKNIKKSV